MKNQSPTWLRTRELAVECAGLLFAQGQHLTKIAQFQACWQDGALRFGKGASEANLNNMLGFLGITKTPPTNKHFDELVSWDMNKYPISSYTLGDNKIEHTTAGITSNVFPKFDFRWRQNENDPSKADLEFLRIDLDGYTFKNYYLDRLSPHYGQGKRELLAKLPNDISGNTNIMGQDITFQIDFEAEAEKILDRSLLREFLMACRLEQLVMA